MREATFTDHDLPAAPRTAAVGGRTPAARRDPDRRAPITAPARRPAPRRGWPRRATASRSSAAIAAGILTIGDEHGGAGSSCMELIAAGLGRARARRPSARRGRGADWSTRRVQAKARLPGFGHRVHSTIDPRVAVLFDAGAGRRPRRRRHPLRAGARSGGRAPRSSRSRSTSTARSPRSSSTSASRRWSAASSSSSAASPGSAPKCSRSTRARSRCASRFRSTTTAFRRRES